jgi:hypothetical protein
MLVALALAALSLAALAYAVRVALSMRADRLARLDRIARATRPVHGRPMRAAPVRFTDKPGAN